MTSPDHTDPARGRLSLLALLPLIVGPSATGRGVGVATTVAVLQQGVST